jgi:hypothetical protein
MPNPNSPLITPVFLQTGHCYHEVVAFLQANKLECDFIVYKKLLSQEQGSGVDCEKFQKSERSAEPQLEDLSEGAKVPLAFVRNEADLRLLEEFIRLYEKQFHQKHILQLDDTSEVKILIFSELRLYEPIKNCVVINESSNEV